jgi:micrococcal nuclease
MIKRFLSVLLPIATIAAFQLPSQAQSLPTAKVVSVGDGDTIMVQQDNNRVIVRLACIDAPESNQLPSGTQSRDRLKALLPVGQAITLRQVDTDKYGRRISEVYLGNRSINLDMVTTGHEVVYQQHLGSCGSSRGAYLKAEANAKTNRLAFWGQACPTMPWDFRQGKTSTCNLTQKAVVGYQAGSCKALAKQGIRGPFQRGVDANYSGFQLSSVQ